MGRGIGVYRCAGITHTMGPLMVFSRVPGRSRSGLDNEFCVHKLIYNLLQIKLTRMFSLVEMAVIAALAVLAVEYVAPALPF